LKDLDPWDAVILVAAAFVAVTSLVRLMLARRDALVHEIKDQIAASRRGKKKKRDKQE
jgi:hypothetical protein